MKKSFVKSLETLSVLAFGLAYWKFDLYVATAVLMATMTLFVVLAKAFREPLTRLQLISWVAVLIFGSATLFLRDESFIKWKPTVINSLIGSVFLVTTLFGKRSLIEQLVAGKFHAPASKLRRVNFACSLFFFLLGYINFQVAFSFSTDVWVQYKIFGNLILNTIFISGCLYYLRDYVKEWAENQKN